MRLSINLHPVDKWEGVQVEVYPAEHGSCKEAFAKLTQREEEGE